MSETAPPAVGTTGGRPGPAPLSTTASITTFGTAVWMGAVWAVAAVAFTVLLVVISWRDGQLDESLWHSLGAGWQRWLAGVAGYTMISEFARMLVTNGVTRARLARSALVTLVALALAGGLFMTLGYVLEGVAYDQVEGWVQRLDGDGPALGGVGDHLRLFADGAVTLAAFFTTGWLLAACYRSRQRDEANLLVLPCLVPAIAAQLLVRGNTTLFGFLDRLDLSPPAVLGFAVTAVVTLLGIAAAVRLTREVVL